ncbi:MAG: sugar phosphate isomerase/epimerase family protein [Bacteroidota bacterium]
MNIAIVTDEISRTLAEALELAQAWGIARFELREGGTARFPRFTPEEYALVETARAGGAMVTAVSPGLFKTPIEDERGIRIELEHRLPEAIEGAQRVGAPLLILFGFGDADRSNRDSRLAVLKTLERAAVRASDAGLRIAIENEPDFWIDRPAETVELLHELGHPAVGLNWDPANQHWGGLEPTTEHAEALRPHLFNLHVKDFTPDDPDTPWRAIGEGVTPWAPLLAWARDAGLLDHVTLETHVEPLIENTRKSIDAVRAMI